MTDTNNQSHPHPETTPPDVRDLAARLDMLAARDRSSTSAGFEDRLLSAVRGGLNSSATPVAGRVGTSRTRNPWAGLRLAATLGVVGSVGILAAVYVMGARQATSPLGVPSNRPIAVTPNMPTPNHDLATNLGRGDALDVQSIEAEFEEYLASLDGAESPIDSLETAGNGFWDVGNSLTQEGSL